MFLLVPAVALYQPVSAPQAAAPQAPDLPPGPGHDTTARVCSGCHVSALYTSQRKSADDWASIVIEMRNRGAVATDGDLEEIVQYLSTTFGPATPAPHVNVNSAAAAEIAGALSLPVAQGTAIVAFREKNGKFKDLTALKKVDAVDMAKIDAAKDRIDF